MSDTEEIKELKAFITDRFIDEKLTEFFSRKPYEDMNGKEKLAIMSLIARKKKMRISARA
tara:strand:- start:244 stop:423 length:180 start_codon:yes stop_codon:yes gene_type:complete